MKDMTSKGIILVFVKYYCQYLLDFNINNIHIKNANPMEVAAQIALLTRNGRTVASIFVE